jgi:hypothetical protein
VAGFMLLKRDSSMPCIGTWVALSAGLDAAEKRKKERKHYYNKY